MSILDKIHLYQVVIVLLAGGMIYQGVLSFARGRQNLLKLAVRLVVWGGMATVALFPNITSILARVIGLEGNINAVILTGFLLIFLMIFKLLAAIERLEEHITDLTRKEALSKLNKNSSDKSH